MSREHASGPSKSLCQLVAESYPRLKAPNELKRRLIPNITLTAARSNNRFADGSSTEVQFLSRGDVLDGKYRLVRRLGGGAMGVVWAAFNERIGRDVALKLLCCDAPDLRVRLEREARALGPLSHPNIVDLYDVGLTESGQPFLVMELLVGETLQDRLWRQRRLDPSLALRVARDVAKALAAAHSLSIIHRDLKPANIFLHETPDSDYPVVKVLDFGLSRNMTELDAIRTADGKAIGSPLYMSPEQVEKRRDTDHRCDIWALGVILFEIVTGQTPFGGSLVGVFRAIVDGEVPRMDKYARNVPAEVVDLVAKCMQRERDERPASAWHVATALDELCHRISRTGQRQKSPRISPAPETKIVSAPRVDLVATEETARKVLDRGLQCPLDARHADELRLTDCATFPSEAVRAQSQPLLEVSTLRLPFPEHAPRLCDSKEHPAATERSRALSTRGFVQSVAWLITILSLIVATAVLCVESHIARHAEESLSRIDKSPHPDPPMSNSASNDRSTMTSPTDSTSVAANSAADGSSRIKQPLPSAPIAPVSSTQYPRQPIHDARPPTSIARRSPANPCEGKTSFLRRNCYDKHHAP